MAMAHIQTTSDRRPSPLLSNNPFRNRTSDPSTPKVDTQPSRPVATNPFLDSSEAPALAQAPAMAMPNGRVSPTKPVATEKATELFGNMTVNENGRSPPRRGPPPTMSSGQRRLENMPPRAYGRMPLLGHRPSQSEEDRKGHTGRSRGPTGELDIFADPPDLNKLRERRPRRNSESSVREKSSKAIDPEDEKRRRERREKRSGKPKPPSRKLDLIDKLDVTSIYGTGLFHHDGPFDACNPHRNRKGSKQAPMQAFPKDSRNMAIGGSGPNNSRLNLEQIHGTGQEAHIDFNEATVADEEAQYIRPPNPGRSTSFNPTARIEPLHGEESVGLGTSTFLEGAPASRAAIQRRESENEAAQVYNGGAGVTRKKSLAQKIRGVRPGGNYGAGGRVTSPEPLKSPTSPLATGKNEGVANPFFKDYDQEYDRKGAQIAFAQEQEQKGGRARAPSSPKRGGMGLVRTMTSESTGGEDGKTGGGFLNRVKSLKGGRRTRTERRDAS